MFTLQIEYEHNAKIYRKASVPQSYDLEDLDELICLVFDIENEAEEAMFEMLIQDSQPIINPPMIYVYPENEQQLNATDFALEDIFLKIDDQLRATMIGEKTYTFTVRLEATEEVEDEKLVCLAGKGNIHTNKLTNISLQHINKELEASFTIVTETPDFDMLFEIANEVKKQKPWQYLTNDNVFAVDIDYIDMRLFFIVLGDGGQEFGFLVFEYPEGYSSLRRMIDGTASEEDFQYALTMHAVNFVSRAELTAEDYDLAKECGFSFRGANNWLQFRSYKEGFVPSLPDFMDVELLKMASIALLEILSAIRGGLELPEAQPHIYPAFRMNLDAELSDGYLLEIAVQEGEHECYVEVSEFEVAQYKRKEKSAIQLEYDLFYLPFAIEQNGGEAIYPLMGLLVERGSNIVIGYEMVPLRKDPLILQSLLWLYLKELDVRPSKIYVSQDNVAIIQPLITLLGLTVHVSDLSAIEVVRQYMVEMPDELFDEE